MCKMEYVGRKLKKDFKGHGLYIGTVKSYDESTGFFTVVYEDGDSEEMDLAEISSLLDAANDDAVEAVGQQITRKGTASGSSSLPRRVGRPRKRRRIGGGTPSASGNDNGNELGLIEGLVNNVGENRFELDLNKELDFNSNGASVEEERLPKKPEFIDLNVDVNENDAFGNKMSREEDNNILGKSIEKKSRGFDLNLGLNDHIVEDLPNGDFSCGIETTVRQQNGEFVKNDVSCINLFNDVEAMNTPNNIITKENEIVGSSGIKKRGRKRKVALDSTTTIMTNTAIMTETSLSLRRSSRRAGKATTSDDSPAVSGVSEEKFTISVPDESEKQIVVATEVELPPSSECLNLEGMPVLDTFSVYAFLRSFSMSLFLSPFEFEDFVVSVKCNTPTVLFDSIHASLLQTLRKHLASLSDEIPASCDCLRSLNWDLLDLVTWPIFMNEYFVMHSRVVEQGFDLRRLKLSGSDYYSQSASLKIEVLRFLCDDVLEVEGITSELNRRSQAIEFIPDFDRNKKPNGYKKKKGAAIDVSGGGSSLPEEEVDEVNDKNSDECCLCKMEGILICCDGCPAAFHARCVGVATNLLPEGDWFCPECLIDKDKPWLRVKQSIRGAELFGTDPCDRQYYSSCDYLLVLSSCGDEASLKYYHRNDLPAVIEALKSSTSDYNHIITAICENWHISSTDGGLKSDQDNPQPSPSSSVKRQRLTRSALHLTPSETCTKDEIETMNHCVKMENPLANSEGLVEDSQVHEVGKRKKVSSSDILNMSSYMNAYSFAHTSSSVYEQLTQKSPDKISPGEIVIRSAEEIISAHLKAISSSPKEFCWPSIHDKKIDARKEKCGWCFGCKYPEYEKECFYNMDDKDLAPESCTKEVLNVCPRKNRIGHFVDVMCHILWIEHRLQGLLVGPWLTPDYSNLWRKIVFKASDIGALKDLLLTLESNLRERAFSSDWIKTVDTVSTIGSARYIMARNKQGTGKKKSRYSEPEAHPSITSKGGPVMFWWRGGRLSRELFNWKVLPKSLARKAARTAGGTKIPGLLYTENSESVRRSKCIVWRGAVEMSSSVQQLALQLREFDANIKWDEIGNTNAIHTMDKETLKSFRSFKKVIIRKKSTENSVVKYLLDFGKRRFIPDVVSKHGTLVVDSSNERKKYWLEESYVPLHLLKLFEEKKIARKSNKITLGKLRDTKKFTITKKRVKKGFEYLFAKADRLQNHQCGHCNKDVSVGEAVTCQHCEGFFHRKHVRKCDEAMSSSGECMYVCHKCCVKTPKRKSSEVGKKSPQIEKIVPPLSNKRKRSGRGRPPLKSQSQSQENEKRKKYHQFVVPLRRSARQAKSVYPHNKIVNVSKKGKGKQIKVVGKGRRGRKPKSEENVTISNQTTKAGTVSGTGKGRKRGRKPKAGKAMALRKLKKVGFKEFTIKRKRTHLCYSSYWLNGLRLSRKANDERVINFRSQNLILISGEPISVVDKPNCSLCVEMEFNPMLNYIACQVCRDWFHGDAFDLGGENIDNVIGFMCHKCRNKNPPICPHLHSVESGDVNGVNLNVELEIEVTNEGAELKEEGNDEKIRENEDLSICREQELSVSDKIREGQESTPENNNNSNSLGDDAVTSNVTTGLGAELTLITESDKVREDQESTQEEVMVDANEGRTCVVGTELRGSESTQGVMVSKDIPSLGDDDAVELNVVTGVETELTESEILKEDHEITQEVMVLNEITSLGNNNEGTGTESVNLEKEQESTQVVVMGVGNEREEKEKSREEVIIITSLGMGDESNDGVGTTEQTGKEDQESNTQQVESVQGHENVITCAGTESTFSKPNIDVDGPSIKE